MYSKRRSFSPQFKAKLALEALSSEHTVSEIAAEHQLKPNMVRRWKDELAAGASVVFDGARLAKDKKRRGKHLRLSVTSCSRQMAPQRSNATGFGESIRTSMEDKSRLELVKPDEEDDLCPIPLKRRCELLGINRS
ncbi:MAG: transposase, partial [Coriobacteriaceae bacterium]|nr:transposase [Coriobacteriaceae bacterium]